MLFRAELGMVDRGADLSRISMYPAEKEILMAPLTGVQILGMQVENHMLVVEVRLVSNLLSQVMRITPQV